MLRNRFAGEILGQIRRLYEAGIQMNGQIVLCRGINDGPELDRTIRELADFMPCFQSLSVVPVGLTRYREGLYPLEPFDAGEAGGCWNRSAAGAGNFTGKRGRASSMPPMNGICWQGRAASGGGV